MIFSTTLDGFYFANCVLSAALLSGLLTLKNNKMKRELKVKIWDKFTKVMSEEFELSEIVFSWNVIWSDRFKGQKEISGCDVIFRQNTEIKDLNNIEIYEGDVLKCGYGIGKVVWQAGCFMVQWLDDKEAYMEFVFSRKGMYVRKDDERFEIIGNIYENPELVLDVL